MLTKLAKYANQVGLVTKRGYTSKEARAVIVINEVGGFLFIEPYSPPRKFELCPNLSQGELIAGGKKRSHFLLDTLGVIGGDDVKTFDKHLAFVEVHTNAAVSVSGLQPIVAFLSDPKQVSAMLAEAKRLRLKNNDKTTFRIQGQDRALPDQTDWHEWWQSYREGLKTTKSDGVEMRCFLSGELVKAAPTHGLKLRLQRVGGQTSGSSLIGFDKESFRSYGLSQSLNAACSVEAAVTYATALNKLIEEAPKPLANCLMLHWFDKSLPREWDPLAGDDDIDDEATRESAQARAKRIAEALRTGARVGLTNNSYHVMLVSASAGRAVVRDYYEGDLTSLVNSIERWYSDLAICGPAGRSEAEAPSLFACLMRLVPYSPDLSIPDIAKRMDEQLGPIIPRVWRSVLDHGPLPQVVAANALRYAQSRLLREKTEGSNGGSVRLPNIDRIACSLLKAWYNRALVQGQQKGGVYVTVGLNKEHPSPAYQAGRLLAILNRLQHEAIPEVGADVVQRFYAAASISPGLVLGRLVSGAQPHLAKLRNVERTNKLSYWFEQQIAQIMSRFGDEMLGQLDFAGQALFALGFYHQVAHRESSGARRAESVEEPTKVLREVEVNGYSESV